MPYRIKNNEIQFEYEHRNDTEVVILKAISGKNVVDIEAGRSLLQELYDAIKGKASKLIIPTQDASAAKAVLDTFPDCEVQGMNKSRLQDIADKKSLGNVADCSTNLGGTLPRLVIFRVPVIAYDDTTLWP